MESGRYSWYKLHVSIGHFLHKIKSVYLVPVCEENQNIRHRSGFFESKIGRHN